MRSLLLQLRAHEVYLISCNHHLIFIFMLKMLSLLQASRKNFVSFESETLSSSFKSLPCFDDYVIHHRHQLLRHMLLCILLKCKYAFEISCLVRTVLQRRVVGFQMLRERLLRVVEVPAQVSFSKMESSLSLLLPARCSPTVSIPDAAFRASYSHPCLHTRGCQQAFLMFFVCA